MKIFIIYTILLLSISYSLSESQLDKIKSKTDNINYAPDFTLQSIQSKSFSNIKSLIKNISNANKLFQENTGNYSKSVEVLIENNLLDIQKNNNLKWSFELSRDNFDITAIHLEDEIKIIYNVNEDMFSFLVQNEKILLTDHELTLSNLRGKVVLINFWATWCGPCRLEIQDFNDLYKKYNEKGFEILGVSISDSKEQLEKFKEAYNIFYPILYGNQTTLSKIQREYGYIYSIPISFLINKEGEIIRVYQSAIVKQFDPNMYADLIINIEKSLVE